MPKFLTLLLALKLLTFKAYSQCTLVTPSTNGYTVTTKINPVAIIANPKPSCPDGYNYNVAINYTITITGTLPGGSLYTMQGYISCGSQSLFYDLPNNAAVGSVTTTSNPYISSNGTNVYTTHPSCTAANVTNLNCNAVQIEINGPGISAQTTSCPNNSTLPITLSYFTAVKNEKTILLKWQTETEKDNDFFELEKSLNGEVWTSVTKIKGAGTTSKRQNYSFEDDGAEQGINYYRLKQTDFDKTSTYSPIIYILNTGGDIFCTNVWPNPVTDKFNFEINAPANGNATYNLLNDVGQPVKNGSIDFYTGKNEVTIVSDDLKQGFYLLEIVFDANHKVYRKIAKL